MTAHALQRIRERYGDFDADVILALKTKILAGDAKFSVGGMSPDCVQAIVSYGGKRFRCAWNVKAKRIITVFPSKGRKQVRRRVVERNGRNYEVD